jgi:anthranilate/para-aminobenzoate synthase component I
MEQMALKKYYKEIKCTNAAEIFESLRKPSTKSFLLESKDISHIYGRLSLIGIDPVLEIRAKDNKFSIEGLNDRAEFYLSHIDELEGEIECEKSEGEEGERTKKKCTVDVIRSFLDKFKQDSKEFVGLYGAFSYDFVRLFEDLPKLLDAGEVDDFRLCLYDSFVYFDHLRELAEIIVYREDSVDGDSAVEEIFADFGVDVEDANFQVSEVEFEFNKDEYRDLVLNAKELAEKGEIFEIVYSNTLKAKFDGDSFSLYKKYSEINPSPYLFYFDFIDEQLVGASPEMMVRCENGKVHMRPIAGTAKRGDDPIEDHENMLELLASEKERSELDMLIDLGRNDLARICKPGIEVSDYRFVEKYSKVMHTVAHLSGDLKDGFTALDSLIACLSAGTLTGAPKVAAMTAIEEHEITRRGYYGGAIGYLTFSGEMDTGILIRTAHIRGGKLTFRVGASLLYDSDPEAEYQETINKAQAFLTAIDHEV